MPKKPYDAPQSGTSHKSKANKCNNGVRISVILKNPKGKGLSLSFGGESEREGGLPQANRFTCLSKAQELNRGHLLDPDLLRYC